MELDSALEKLLSGEAIMFAGAGCSIGAKNLKDNSFPTGSELASYLAARAEIELDTPLEDAAEAYIDKFGTDSLIREIKEEFTARKISKFHENLGNLPWKKIYTANYDDVLEEAYKVNQRILNPVTASDNPHLTQNRETNCIHLNGYVHRLDREKIGTELKLTETSYIVSSIEESPWGLLFQADVRHAQTIFIIGYSLYDLDIKRLLYSSPSLKEKTFFILGANPNPTVIRRVEKFGHVVLNTLEEFVSLAQNKRKTFKLPVKRKIETISIHEYQSPARGEIITDQAFWELMMYGSVKERMVYESITQKTPYLMERTSIPRIFEFIEQGKRIITINSDLGNGKSLLLNSFRFRAKEKGYRVFDVTDQTEEAIAELHSLTKLEEKTIVIIEGYKDWVNEIKIFMLNANININFILTERTAVHDLAIDNLMSSTGLDDIAEISLDKLDDTEIDWFINSFGTYGLWGRLAARTRDEKKGYLSVRCGKQIHAILLDRLSSPEIAKRLTDLSKELSQDRTEYEIFISICILNITSQQATFDTLVDLWGSGKLGSSKFRRSSVVKQLLSFTTEEVLLKSAIAARYILKNIVDPAITVSVLKKMVSRADVGAYMSRKYTNMLSNLVRYSNVQQILPETGKGALIFSFYESAKDVKHYSETSLFWLQYAIACLSIDDIPRAKNMFDTAYSWAFKRTFDTYQIDNHYARFLLVEAVQGLSEIEAMNNFRTASSIVNRQIEDQKVHYPYRVAYQYQSFFNRFSNTLTTGQLREIEGASLHILANINTLPPGRANNRYIRRCKNSMEYIIRKITELLKKVDAEPDTSNLATDTKEED